MLFVGDCRVIVVVVFFFLMIRRPPRSTQSRSSAASDVYKRQPMHVVEAAKMGSHIATIPYNIIKQMLKHPLTDAGIEKFLHDWKQAF